MFIVYILLTMMLLVFLLLMNLRPPRKNSAGSKLKPHTVPQRPRDAVSPSNRSDLPPIDYER